VVPVDATQGSVVDEPAVRPVTEPGEIRDVVARLAHLADAGDVGGYVALMTDDVVWVMPASPHIGLAASERRGRDEIAAGARERIANGIQGAGSNTMHTVSTIAVSSVSSTEAVAESTFVFWTSTTTTPTPTSIGRYHDTFRLIDGAWKLARREVRFG
jgi:ketosteroid isomerase-like protein